MAFYDLYMLGSEHFQHLQVSVHEINHQFCSGFTQCKTSTFSLILMINKTNQKVLHTFSIAPDFSYLVGSTVVTPPGSVSTLIQEGDRHVASRLTVQVIQPNLIGCNTIVWQVLCATATAREKELIFNMIHIA